MFIKYKSCAVVEKLQRYSWSSWLFELSEDSWMMIGFIFVLIAFWVISGERFFRVGSSAGGGIRENLVCEEWNIFCTHNYVEQWR